MVLQGKWIMVAHLVVVPAQFWLLCLWPHHTCVLRRGAIIFLFLGAQWIVHAWEKGTLTKEKKPHFKILIVVSFFSILCWQRAERRPHLSSFLGALIFDWACARDKEPLYLKEIETTIIELLCLVPTRRVGALIIPWHPAIARVLRERRPHLCPSPRCHDGSGRGAVLAPCAEGNIIFFFSACSREGFFPRPVPSYLLAPGASASEIRLPSVQAAGRTKQLICAESFLGGVLLGIMFAEHDAPPRFNSYSCHGSIGTVVFFILVGTMYILHNGTTDWASFPLVSVGTTIPIKYQLESFPACQRDTPVSTLTT